MHVIRHKFASVLRCMDHLCFSTREVTEKLARVKCSIANIGHSYRLAVGDITDFFMKPPHDFLLSTLVDSPMADYKESVGLCLEEQYVIDPLSRKVSCYHW